MEITTVITKDQFEQAVPAAKEPRGTIFAKLERKINSAIEDIIEDNLGVKGNEVLQSDPNGRLAITVMQLASVNVFLHEMRNLDLVLTNTGFGVVSTNDTAPASKLRVDALDGELRVKWLTLHDEMLKLCFAIEGWYQQGLVVIDSLFCFFGFLKKYAGYQAPISKDWEDVMSVVLATDRWIREKISDEFMDELIAEMATCTLNDANRGIVHQVRRIIGVAIKGDRQTQYEYLRRLMNTLEGDIDSFPTYAGSLAFEVNHFKPYENRKDDSAFHFVG